MKKHLITPKALDHKMDDLSEGEVAEALGDPWDFLMSNVDGNGGPDGSEIFHSCLVGYFLCGGFEQLCLNMFIGLCVFF